MGRIEKTVFISYRRANLPWALFIWQNLTMHGYDVFFDYQSIDSGSFERVILDNIRARAHFIVVLTPSALERCKNPGDWLRREIETAIDEKRNIVPLMLEGFDFGSPLVKEVLTGKLAALSSINGLPMPDAYAVEALNRLRDRYLNVALSDVAMPIINAEAQKITNTQKEAASEAAPVNEKQLSAQTWFERGYVFQKDKNFKEALHCYSEAIRLDPNLDRAYNNLGILYSNLKFYENAETAYRKAIELNPSDATAYNNFGVLLHENLKRYKEAEVNYRNAIALDPSDAMAYNNLGYELNDLNRYEEAESTLRKAIELDASYPFAYNNLGIALKGLKRYSEAEASYRKTIELIPSNAAVYYNLGNLLKELKHYDEAEIAYRKAIKLNPSFMDFYNNLVGLYRFNLRSKLNDAIPLLKKMIKFNPEDLNSYIAIASINKQLGKGISKEYTEKARQFMPEDDWYNRACLESVCDNFDLAFEYLRRAAQGEKFDPAWAWNDLDLQWIRDDPRFIEIVGPRPE